MGVLMTLVTILLVADGIILIGFILLQRGRGSGLASAFGGIGAEAAFGTRAATVAQKITAVCGALLLLLTIVLGLMKKHQAIRIRATAPRSMPGSGEGSSSHQHALPTQSEGETSAPKPQGEAEPKANP